MREGYLDVGAARLYVRELGEGCPVVVLHGGPDFNHRYLLPELDGLARAAHLVHYDQRGRGRSSPHVQPQDVNVASEVDDLDRVRRHFGLAAMTLLGHSWGCLLALEYAARHPGRVERLVLMNPAPVSHAGFVQFAQHRRATEPARLAAMREVADMPQYATGDVEADAAYHRLHYGSTVVRPGVLDALISRLGADFTREGILRARAIEARLVAQTLARPEYDVLARLAPVGIPVLVMHAEHDFIPAGCAAAAIARGVAHARLLSFAGCGHFAYAERPVEVLAAIAAFLAPAGS